MYNSRRVVFFSAIAELLVIYPLQYWREPGKGGVKRGSGKRGTGKRIAPSIWCHIFHTFPRLESRAHRTKILH